MENLIKNNKFINMLYRVVGSMIVRFFGLFIKIDDNRILFSSGMGNFIGDSPLFLYKELKVDPDFKDFEMIWAVKDLDKYKGNYNLVRINTPKYFYYALSSRIWITSVNIERGLNFKKKDTIYLNTWHGIPLKHIGLDVKARKDYDFSRIDIFLSSGDYERKIYKKAFNLTDQQIFTTGLPRNSVLESYVDKANNEDRYEIIDKIGLKDVKGRKIILFAPTWKDYDYKQLNLSRLCDGLDESYIILFKSHPLESWDNIDSRVIDVSHIDDIISLMKVSDILISDYSSIMIDYSILKRPIFAFIPDYDTYKSTRGLYVTRKELAPNTIIDEDGLIARIRNIDYNKEEIKTRSYSENFLQVSSLDSIETIINFLKKKLYINKGE